VGDLVYARVTAAERDLDPVLACTDAQGKVSTSCPLAPWSGLDAIVCCVCCNSVAWLPFIANQSVALVYTHVLHVLHMHMKMVQSNVEKDLSP